MVSLLAAAALAAALPETAPLPQPAPAMFEIHDADTTIYLFGTFHALDEDQQWFGYGVRDAFEQSNELVLETLLPEGPRAAEQMKQSIKAPSVAPSATFLTTTKMAISAGRSQGVDAGPVARFGRDAVGVEARRPERVCSNAEPTRRRLARNLSNDVHRAERALG